MDLVEIPSGELKRHPWEIARADSILRAIGAEACASVVDVGAGDRYFLGRLSRRSAARLTAVDVGYHRPAEADGLRLLTSVADLAEESQDLALLMDVLEHSRDDGQLLEAAFRKVRPGGRLVVTVPAFPSLYSSHDVALGHLRRYRRHRLSGLAHALAIESVEVFHFFGSLFAVRSVQVCLERLGFRTAGERNRRLVLRGDAPTHQAPGGDPHTGFRPLPAGRALRSASSGAFIMPDPQETVCLVVPCYNEATRLDFPRLAAGPVNCRLLFVDDGSTDGTADVIRAHLGDRGLLLNLAENRGKAEAVRAGMLHALQVPSDRAAWIGYWDADLSTPLSEVGAALRFASLYPARVDAVWGSRVYRLGSRIRRSYARHLAGRLVATAAGLLLGLESYDSQCGAKLFRREIVGAAFSEPFVSRWLFDMELLLRLADCQVVEYPLIEWTARPGSWRNLPGMARSVVLDLARIRLRYGRLPRRG